MFGKVAECLQVNSKEGKSFLRTLHFKLNGEDEKVNIKQEEIFLLE